jgi:hypothetical protein
MGVPQEHFQNRCLCLLLTRKRVPPTETEVMPYLRPRQQPTDLELRGGLVLQKKIVENVSTPEFQVISRMGLVHKYRDNGKRFPQIRFLSLVFLFFQNFYSP